MAGFIYIMSNPAFISGLIKIGKSDRDPSEFRKNELETTGVPAPFKVEYYAFVEDHHRVEREIHKILSNSRLNSQREFFIISIADAISNLKSITEINFEKIFTQESNVIDEDLIDLKISNLSHNNDQITSINYFNKNEIENEKLKKICISLLKFKKDEFGRRGFQHKCKYCNSNSRHSFYDNKNLIMCQQCSGETILN